MTMGMGGAWIIYIIASCCAPATWYINNTVNVNQVFKNIENAIAAAPICKLHIQNYHYEDRVEHYKDHEGNAKTRTKRVRVNTHAHTEGFNFTHWVDKSPPSSALHYIDLFLLTRIFTFKYVNLSPKAQRNYDQQYANFMRVHHRDEHYDFSFTKTIPCHEEQCLAYNPKKGGKPWFTNCCILIILDILSLGWI